MTTVDVPCTSAYPDWMSDLTESDDYQNIDDCVYWTIMTFIYSKSQELRKLKCWGGGVLERPDPLLK